MGRTVADRALWISNIYATMIVFGVASVTRGHETQVRRRGCRGWTGPVREALSGLV